MVYFVYMSFYLPWKSQLYVILKKHLPTELVDRFTFRSDSEVFIPKEDEGVWNRWKTDHENMHVLFDGLEIIEIPEKLDKRYAEVFLLKAFRDAIKDGRISIETKIEWSDNATARKRKKENEEKKAKKRREVIQEARYHMGEQGLNKVVKNLPDVGKKVINKIGGE